MRIGLFFGSFNPIHIGHIAIAKYMLKATDLDQVWLVVSPKNPLKNKNVLADAKKRLRQVKKAIGKSAGIKVSNVEFALRQPSYTIRTLRSLGKKHPHKEFVLIIGSDNLELFYEWKEYKKILAGYKIYVYPRKNSVGGKLRNHASVKMTKAPLINVSSTFIREQVGMGKDVKHLIPKIR